MLGVIQNRTYRDLAQVVALIGTGLLTVALGLLAYDLAGQRRGPFWARPWLSRWWPMRASHP